MKPQRLYWLAEITERQAARWRERTNLRSAVGREAREALSDGEWAEVLGWLHARGRIEYKPGRGRKDMIRRVAPPTE